MFGRANIGSLKQQPSPDETHRIRKKETKTKVKKGEKGRAIKNQIQKGEMQ
jgi:hypothetical protein